MTVTCRTCGVHCTPNIISAAKGGAPLLSVLNHP
jgi:hypothetical protein